jgi:hypothetical protein
LTFACELAPAWLTALFTDPSVIEAVLALEQIRADGWTSP